jgi:predicted dehydrogenase
MDGQVELVCGAFSADPQKALASGADLFLPPARCYGSYEEMIRAEAALPLGLRMDFLAIVTPNHMHFAPAKMALEHGFHVLSDKPATFDAVQARTLQAIVAQSGMLYGLTHNYTGYPLVKQMRAMVRAGTIGAVRKVVVEYPQGWLATRLEESGQKQASWRTDPSKSGAAGCVGDIGTHAENLAEYVTGLRIKELAADLTSFVDGRLLDDDASMLLRFADGPTGRGAKGVLHCSQIAVGEENNLNLRVWGENGGLEWHQREPNTLWFKPLGAPVQVLRAGHGYLHPEAQAACRTPPAHPEGYLEAFANIYRAFAGCVRARLEGREPTAQELDFPTIADGVRGMAFIDAVVASGKANAAWTPVAPN